MSASTAESELLAASEAHVGTLSVNLLLTEVTPRKFKQLLAVDDAAAVTLANSTGATSWRTRHLWIRAAVLCDCKVLVKHCAGQVEIADLLTKALPAPRLAMLSDLIGLADIIQPLEKQEIKIKLLMKCRAMKAVERVEEKQVVLAEGPGGYFLYFTG